MANSRRLTQADIDNIIADVKNEWGHTVTVKFSDNQLQIKLADCTVLRCKLSMPNTYHHDNFINVLGYIDAVKLVEIVEKHTREVVQ